MSVWGPGPPNTPRRSSRADESLPLVPRLPWMLRATPAQIAIATVGFALAVFAVALIADWLAYKTGYPPVPMFALSDGLTAIFAAMFALVMVSRASERRRVVHDRLRMVAELNHHIRNALEIIQMSAHNTKDKQAIATINEAADRIQLALREILGDSPPPRR